MCGIAGIVGRIDGENRSALRRMNAAMAHRGPDGEGFWESAGDGEGWGLVLAHLRLSILDLSNAAAQPMVDPLSGDVVVLNGEIYNYRLLRAELEAAGHSFQSSGDTAVMLRALSVRGAQATSALRGMFAFAFWDLSERTLLLARDPLGIKPLYMVRNPDPRGNWSVAFASELRALLASGLISSPALNPLAAASVVWNGFMVAPLTAVAQIETVMPGELRLFDARGVQITCKSYWSLAGSGSQSPITEEDLASALAESVHLHLASDAPLGVFLSGGVDSSVVANLAQKASTAQISTFTLAFDEAEYSEGLIARQVAEAIGTRHQELVLPSIAWISRPSMDSTLITCPTRYARQASRWRWSVAGAMSCSGAIPRSGTCRCSRAGLRSPAGCRALSSAPSVRSLPGCYSLAPAAFRRRPAGPSCPRCLRVAAICWRSTSWLTRCFCRSFSVSCWEVR
jgi:asparagine synthase (glutamine-hydrolysing)